MNTVKTLLSSMRVRAPSLLPGYSANNFIYRYKYLLIALLYCALGAVGFAIGGAAEPNVLLLAIPIGLLLLLVIWALPQIYKPPLQAVVVLFFAYVVGLLIWPDYLAIALPGLPWITVQRLTAIPLLVVFLLSLSVSPEFRKKILDVLQASRRTSLLLVGLIVISFISILYSTNPSISADRFLTSVISLYLIFFASCWVFLSKFRINVFLYLVWGGGVVLCMIALLESRMQAVPWAGSIPSFLVVEDPVVQRILSGASRAGVGIHRVQAKFATPLNLAEMLALITPFVIYFLVYSKNKVIKVLAGLTLPLMLQVIFLTDSRLGFVGFCISFIVFAFIWAVLRWYRVRDGIVGTAITLAFPAIFAAFVASTFFVGRIRNRFWGNSSHSFSTDAREEQWADAIPLVLSRPWGYGVARGGETLGYTNQAGVLTIDSYYLTILLDIGIVGFIVYYGIMISHIIYGSFAIKNSDSELAKIIIPSIICLVNFLVIKSVLSQQEGHPFVFAVLGLISALIYTVKKNEGREVAGNSP